MKSVLSRKIQGAAALVALAVILVMFWAFSSSAQSMTFTQSMEVGSQGTQVTALQTYLATTVHYPEKLVTGYFGALTQAAVQRFQCAEEIVCSGTPATTGYGRVGPRTLMQLNLRAGGSIRTDGADTYAPFISGTAVSAVSSTTATISFSTNEPASGKIFHASSPLTFSEGMGIGFAPIVGGTSVIADSNLRTAHAVTLLGLSPNTTYFYVVQAIDGSGNLSVTWPTTFKTAQ